MSEFQARWVSKKQAQEVKRSADAGEAILLDSFKGFIVVEPRNQRLGDGAVLTAAEMEFELRPEWCQGPKTRVAAARRLLGLAKTHP